MKTKRANGKRKLTQKREFIHKPVCERDACNPHTVHTNNDARMEG